MTAFLSLAAAEPGIIFTNEKSAFWTAENIIKLPGSPAPKLTLVIYKKNLHHALRARFNRCPLNVPECVPKTFFTLEVPTGQRELTFSDSKDTLAIEVNRVPLHPLYLLFLGLLLAAIVVAFSGISRVVASLSLLTGGLYFSITMGRLRGLDVSGHINHVERIARDGIFVNSNSCWECFHPPLYYILSSLFLGYPSILWPSGAIALQGLALVMHILSAPLIVAVVKPHVKGNLELLIFSALVALWPAAVLHSVRLGNDGLFSLASFLFLYFLSKERWKSAATVAAIAVLVKSNAIILMAIASAWISWNCAKQLVPRKTAVICGLILIAGLAAGTISQKLKKYDPARMSTLAERLEVNNTPANILLPDPIAFALDPFINPWIPTVNRNHIQNYFWKSSLFGEWTYEFPYSQDLARVLSTILMALLALTVAIFVRAEQKALVALSLFFSLGAIVGYRLLHNFACNADFRFVYPLVALPIAIILAQARGKKLRLFVQATILGFLGVAQVFFALLWLFESR